MTLQTIPLFFIPVLLAIDIYAILIGRRGLTKLHRLAQIIGISALIMLAMSLLALIDLVSQIWVMRPANISGEIYIVSGICFVIFSLGALILSIKLRGNDSQRIRE
jgi:hypothetical protein